MSDSNEGRVLLTINILILRNISMSANGRNAPYKLVLYKIFHIGWRRPLADVNEF